MGVGNLLLFLCGLVLVSGRLVKTVDTSLEKTDPAPESDATTEEEIRNEVIAKAESKGVDCSNAGTSMNNIFRDLQTELGKSSQTLKSRCETRRAKAKQVAIDTKLKHKADYEAGVKTLEAAFAKTMQPLLNNFADVTLEEEQKVAKAAALNETAHAEMADDESRCDRLRRGKVQAEAELVNQTKAANGAFKEVTTAAKLVSTGSYSSAAAAHKSLDATAEMVHAKSVKRCAADHAASSDATVRHKELIDKVMPLVKALQDCKAKKSAESKKATVASAFLETLKKLHSKLLGSFDCASIHTKLLAGFHHAPESMLLEVQNAADPLKTTMDIFKRVQGKLLGWEDEKKTCEARGDGVRDAALNNGVEIEKNATKAADDAYQILESKGSAARDAHILEYKDIVIVAEEALAKAVAKLYGVAGVSEGSNSKATQAAAALKDKKAARTLKTIHHQELINEQKQKSDVVKNDQDAKLDAQRQMADQNSDNMLVILITEIKKECEAEAQVLEMEEREVVGLELAFFADVGKIVTSSAEVVKPTTVVVKTSLANGDKAVNTYAFVRLSKTVEDSSGATWTSTSICATQGHLPVDVGNDNRQAVCDASKRMDATNVGYLVAEMHPGTTAQGVVRLISPKLCSEKDTSAYKLKYKTVVSVLGEKVDAYVVCSQKTATPT